jgi:hypothetical protein
MKCEQQQQQQQQQQQPDFEDKVLRNKSSYEQVT